MKKASPLQVKNAVKTAGKKSKMTEMERYAKARNAQLKPPAIAMGPVEFHDPHSDLHHLERAAEIKANPTRHRAAMAIAKKKIKSLTSIAK